MTLIAFFTPPDNDVPTRADIDELFMVARLPERKLTQQPIWTVVGADVAMDIDGHTLCLIQYAGGETAYVHRCGFCDRLVDEEYWAWHLRTSHKVDA